MLVEIGSLYIGHKADMDGMVLSVREGEAAVRGLDGVKLVVAITWDGQSDWCPSSPALAKWRSSLGLPCNPRRSSRSGSKAASAEHSLRW